MVKILLNPISNHVVETFITETHFMRELKARIKVKFHAMGGVIGHNDIYTIKGSFSLNPTDCQIEHTWAV